MKRISLAYLNMILVFLVLPGSACATPPQPSTEISLAPIHEVKVSWLKSNPPQASVFIKGGLRDSCASFHDAVVAREGNTITIKVTTQHRLGVACAELYGYFEKNINLGSDFTAGTIYTLKVNDYTTTF